MSHDIAAEAAAEAAGVLPDPNPTWEEIAALPGSHVEVVPGTLEGAARAWSVQRGRQYEDDAPVGAHVMPSGNWVQVVDAHTLTRGDKRSLIREASKYDNPGEQAMALTDLLHRRLITAWSYPHPLPSEDPGVLDLLPVEDDDALDNLIAEANRLMFPRPVTPDDHADPTSPTAPSGA